MSMRGAFPSPSEKGEWAARRVARGRLRLMGSYPYPAANIGRNHPDYGMSVKEHLISKEIRQIELAELASQELAKPMPRRFGVKS